MTTARATAMTTTMTTTMPTTLPTAMPLVGEQISPPEKTRAPPRKNAAPSCSRRYWIESAMVKIGKYMAISIVPIDPPIKTIIRGSSIEVSAATATSTSSS